jgi:peptidoglycan/xylan/chitin deacetylase (PgdA/CDA1 family)
MQKYRGVRMLPILIISLGIIFLIMNIAKGSVETVTEPEVSYVPVETESATSTQYVLLSFDGSKSNAMWKDTLDFAKEMNDGGKPLHFTYFINGVYLLLPQNSFKYNPPNTYPGHSKIGFADGPRDIEKRVENINRAISEGHEIGSHAAGHFAGGSWSYDNWNKEFSEQIKLISNVSENNPEVSSTTVINIDPSKFSGFRAPELSYNESMYKVLRDYGFKYDSSKPGKMDTPPQKDSYGIWHIPLVSMPMKDRGSYVLSMDYNLWETQTYGQESAVKDTPFWNDLKNEVLGAFKDYFSYEYFGPRNPVVIGNHFSLWNDGVYWESMKEFAREVCGLKDVKCVTMNEYVIHLNKINK